MTRVLYLITEEIQKTIDKLYSRITDRFPSSGLSQICSNLYEISKETNKTILWILRPNILVRLFVFFIIGVASFLIVYTVSKMKLVYDGMNISDFIQMIESALAAFVMIAAGVVFLVSMENKQKRGRVIKAINKLRCQAHIIDMHQLAKDPDSLGKQNVETQDSEKRTLNKYQMCRYLDFCTELLSLLSKLGFLYVQNFPDPSATDAVNDLEDLTTGLCQKIWQKITIINSQQDV